MTLAQDGDHRAAGDAAGLGDLLRHRAVPDALGFDEACGCIGRGDAVGRAGLRCRAVMRGQRLGQPAAVGLRRAGRRADALALRLGDGGPAVAGGAADQRPFDVQRHHRQPVQPCELQNRQVEVRVEAPDRAPIGLPQELRLRQFPRRPAVEHRLEPARQHLHPDGKVRIERMQPGKRMELPAVMVRPVMLLAQQDHRRLGQPAQQRNRLHRRSGAVGPDARRHAADARGILRVGGGSAPGQGREDQGCKTQAQDGSGGTDGLARQDCLRRCGDCAKVGPAPPAVNGRRSGLRRSAACRGRSHRICLGAGGLPAGG